MSNDKKPDEGNSPPAGEDHRRRMRFQFRDLMEDLIEDGRRRGLFDDLPGSGRPLDLGGNPYEGSNALANQLMKDNDIRPPWLTHRLDVSAKIDAFRDDVTRTWQRYGAARDQAAGSSHHAALAVGWDEVCRGWQAKIEAINRDIDAYNLKRPHGQMELFKLRLADELKRVDAPRYL
jgi:hypothetical protein